MRIINALAIVVLSLFVVQSALAQGSLLGQVEQALQSAGGAQAANGYLGAELEDEGQMGKGVLVTRIRAGTPAEKGGLKAGDLITSVDGKPVTNLDAYDAVAKRPAGTTINMSVVRNGAPLQLPVTLGVRPAAPPVTDTPETTPGAPSLGSPATPSTGTLPPAGSPPGPAPSLLPATGGTSPSAPGSTDIAPRTGGIVATPQSPAPGAGAPGAGVPSTSIGDLPPSTNGAAGGASGGASLGVRLPRPESGRFRSQRGAFIEFVNPGTPADQAGLKAGQLIVQLDAQRIETDDDLINAIRARQPGQSVELTVRDGNQTFKRTVRLAQAGAAPAPGTMSPASPGGTGRPLLDRIDRIADSFSPRPYSTVYDPLAFAGLEDRVTAIENRLKAIEAKLGITPPAGASPSGPLTPGFGTTTPPTTPGFGPTGGGTVP